MEVNFGGIARDGHLLAELVINNCKLSNPKTYTRAEFIKAYGHFIQSEIKGSGIHFETLVAQAILESSGKDKNGNWVIGGSKLSQKAHNLFGIKANSTWKGKVYHIDTAEYDKNGNKYIQKDAGFRSYGSYKDSIKDYIQFLKKNGRYSNALKAPDYYEQAKRIQKAGYATSPIYADSIKNIVDPLKNNFDEAKKSHKKTIIIEEILIPILVIGIVIGGIHYLRKRN